MTKLHHQVAVMIPLLHTGSQAFEANVSALLELHLLTRKVLFQEVLWKDFPDKKWGSNRI